VGDKVWDRWVFFRGGLDKTPALIWDALLEDGGWVTRKELAKRTGKNPSTISRAMKQLLAFGLVKKESLGFQGVWDEDRLDEIAEELRTAGSRDRRRAKYASRLVTNG
jgi:DNA-binding transcriptional ArsR family regulator